MQAEGGTNGTEGTTNGTEGGDCKLEIFGRILKSMLEDHIRQKFRGILCVSLW